METVQAHAKSVAAVAAELGADPEKGLSPAQAQERLRSFGANELTEKPRPGFLALLWDQFNNYLVIILIIAAVISFALGEWVDAIAIMCIVVLNAMVGVIQESKAEQALAALKKMAAPNAQVIRDGHQVTVAGRELVPYTPGWDPTETGYDAYTLDLSHCAASRSDALAMADGGSKLKVLDVGIDPGGGKPYWGFDPSQFYTLLTALFGFTLFNLAAYGTDHDLTQRVLTCKSAVKGSRATIGAILLGAASYPSSVRSSLIGVSMFLIATGAILYIEPSPFLDYLGDARSIGGAYIVVGVLSLIGGLVSRTVVSTVSEDVEFEDRVGSSHSG